jgi:hypothetical protein
MTKEDRADANVMQILQILQLMACYWTYSDILRHIETKAVSGSIIAEEAPIQGGTASKQAMILLLDSGSESGCGML